MINRILGKRIFKARNVESTSTICKIRNAEDVRITIEHSNGETEVIHLPSDCDLDTKEGERKMRDTLKTRTDLTSSKESKHYRSVDIRFPISFLKVNININQEDLN